MDYGAFDPLKLENQLCFPLYACAREVVKQYKPFLDEIGLTYTQYIVMMVLWEARQTTSKAIGDRLHLDSGTLTPLLKKLAEKGLVTRSRSHADERNLDVALTDEGARVASMVLNRHNVLKAFLLKLGVSEKTADGDACLMEHILSAETMERVQEFLEADAPAPAGDKCSERQRRRR